MNKNIIRSYFNQSIKVATCKQFNKRVELNLKIKAFENKHGLSMANDTLEYTRKILLNGVHVANKRYKYEAHKSNTWNFDPTNYELVYIQK